MKILTLNAHSLSEKNQNEKIKQTADFILEEGVDVILLQEVCQTIFKGAIDSDDKYIGEPNLKKDNYAQALSNALEQKYAWTWAPIKIGFGRFEEGVAIFSKTPILEREEFVISKAKNFMNWRKRATLGIRNEKGWFFTTHMGWWQDEEDPFLGQWEQMEKHIRKKEGKIYLAGDFNAPDIFSDQSYQTILKSGWLDSYMLAKEKIGKDSAKGNIIGWNNNEMTSMRIDYVFMSEEMNVEKYEIVFDGKRTPQVSDHYGVFVTIEE
ncbi:MAG: endonuclease/exonuclease/phosphatase family protein [Bacillota bacterium]|nr:endonuclease/exonuclease/phosphatase family protein [Bacillota bacterium]